MKLGQLDQVHSHLKRNLCGGLEWLRPKDFPQKKSALQEPRHLSGGFQSIFIPRLQDRSETPSPVENNGTVSAVHTALLSAWLTWRPVLSRYAHQLPSLQSQGWSPRRFSCTFRDRQTKCSFSGVLDYVNNRSGGRRQDHLTALERYITK